MFQLDGKEFGELIKRKFAPDFKITEASGSLNNVFECHTQSFRNESFDILKLTSNFHDDVKVYGLNDTSHVSLHFQLAGKSDANISGFKTSLPLEKGRFNLMNCVDPISSFVFPKQHHYEYLCIGLKPSFFNEILVDCGDACADILNKSQERESFSLFQPNNMTNNWQYTALKLLQNPPLSNNLKPVYIKSKIKELVLLAIESYPFGKYEKEIIKPEVEKLNSVKNYLLDNYLSFLTLDGICRDFGLNEFKLKRGFKKLFGITVFGYIHQLRMAHANRLLLDSGLSIGEIAAIIGYTSDASFIRSFKQYYGYSPGKHQLLAKPSG
jgi:AraC family transcriptional activator of pyochelin receptor